MMCQKRGAMHTTCAFDLPYLAEIFLISASSSREGVALATGLNAAYDRPPNDE